MKKIILVIIAAILIAPLAYAAGLVRLDTSQTNQFAPSAVVGRYKPYCDATGANAGNFITAATHLTYNGSGVLISVTEMDATMTGAYIKVTSASYTGTGWSCGTAVWPSQLLSLTNPPTQTFSIPGQVAYVSDSDAPLTICLAAAKLVPYVSNVR